MNKQPIISVIASDSEEFPLHPKTLYSLFTQQLDDWEFFLIADKLSDPIEEITRRANDERITIFSGHSSHMLDLWNTALDQAMGQYVTYLSSGLVYYPTHLQVFAQTLAEHEDVILAYSGREQLDRNYSLHPGALMHRRLENTLFNEDKQNPFQAYWEDLHHNGAFVRITNKTWEKVSDFNLDTITFPTYSPLEVKSDNASRYKN